MVPLLLSKMSKKSYTFDPARLAHYAYKDQPSRFLGGQIDKEHTSKYPWSTVANQAKQVVWVLRGSKNNTTDRDFDSAIQEGKVAMSARYRRSRKELSSILKKYPGKPVHIVGHSGGGTLAMFHARENPGRVRSHAFAPGFTGKGIKEWNQRYPGKPLVNNVDIHVNPRDKLSSPALRVAHGKKIRYGTKKGMNPHDPKNFIVS